MDIEILGSSDALSRTWRSDVVFVMPFTDAAQASRSANLMAKRAGAPGLLLAVHDDTRDGFIHLANRIFRCTRSIFFGYVAQDAYAGRYWLRTALAAFENPRAHLLAFNDGKWFGTLAAYGLARRSWAETLYGGAFFFDGYRSHYADTEISLIAAEQKALAYAAGSLLVEVDWEKDTRAVDPDDRRLFRERAAGGFDGRVRSEALLKQFG